LVGEGESGSASTIYGPVRAGLTTSPATNKEVQLSELLNSLEKRVEILESKYLEVLDTFLNVTARLAALSLTTINEIIIEEEDKC
jgi:predicted house-cleaning noncanonical NTP pyrophosphatase (MazG superfamily)